LPRRRNAPSAARRSRAADAAEIRLPSAASMQTVFHDIVGDFGRATGIRHAGGLSGIPPKECELFRAHRVTMM